MAIFQVSRSGLEVRIDIDRPHGGEAEKIPDDLNQIQSQERVVDFGPLLRKVYDRYRKIEFWIRWMLDVTLSRLIFLRYNFVTDL